MMHLPPMRSNGFGVVSVSGRSRSPRPPAIRMASSGKIEWQAAKSHTSAILPSASMHGTSVMLFFLISRTSSTSILPALNFRKLRCMMSRAVTSIFFRGLKICECRHRSVCLSFSRRHRQQKAPLFVPTICLAVRARLQAMHLRR